MKKYTKDLFSLWVQSNVITSVLMYFTIIKSILVSNFFIPNDPPRR